MKLSLVVGALILLAANLIAYSSASTVAFVSYMVLIVLAFAVSAWLQDRGL